MSRIEKIDYVRLSRITDLSGKECPDEEEKKFVGHSGLILHLGSENYPGRTFFQFYPSDPNDLLSKEVLTTAIGKLFRNRNRSTLSLRTRFDKIYVFSTEYSLTPDEKCFLRIRAGLEE